MSKLILPRRTVLKGRGRARAGRTKRGTAGPNRGDQVAMIAAAAEPIPLIETAAVATFVDRYSDAEVVLLVGSTHGTDKFDRARAAITDGS